MAAIASDPAAQALLLWTQQSLQHHLYDNATFLAERLHAHAPSEGAAHVLATCHFTSGSKVRAYHLLQGCRSPQNRYLLALCCLELGHLDEAERVLLGPSLPGTAGGANATPAAISDVPNGAAGLYLLGVICIKTQRRAQAARYYTQALELNPYLWSAYEGLCQLGVDLPPLAASAAPIHAAQWLPPADVAPAAAAAHAPTPCAGSEPLAQQAHGSHVPPPIDAGHGAAGAVPATPSPFSPMGMFAFTPMSLSQSAANNGLSPFPHIPSGVPGGTLLGGASGEGAWAQPSPMGSGATPMSESPDSSVGAPPRRRAGGAGGAMGSWLMGIGSTGGAPSSAAPPSAGLAGSIFGAALSAAATPTGADDSIGRGSAQQRKGTRSTVATGSAASVLPVRRSSRLSGGSALPFRQPAAPGTAGRAGGGGEQGSGVSGRPLSHSGGEDDERGSRDTGKAATSEPLEQEGVCPAASLLHHLARALLAVSTYRCAHALELLERLPACQRKTGWVLCQIGRAHFESVNYAEAERAFASALSTEPHRLAGHELHSTLLWHLRAEVKLCFLAQHAVALDRKSAHTWAILGNCFSLQKEHDTALRFLKRAIQLEPDFAYAHTLCGHEYAAIEDFDKALGAYRRAILLDERHYNGWYGLGSIYFRQEKYELAEFHLARALEINPGSSPLQCYFGMAIHEKALAEGQRPERALAVLERAIELDPHNPLARFQKARVLLSLEERQLALEELLALREFAPKEGAVHLLLGRIYKKLGQPQKALVCMSTALDLNPKDAQMIKSAIHKLDSIDDDDVEDGP